MICCCAFRSFMAINRRCAVLQTSLFFEETYRWLMRQTTFSVKHWQETGVSFIYVQLYGVRVLIDVVVLRGCGDNVVSGDSRTFYGILWCFWVLTGLLLFSGILYSPTLEIGSFDASVILFIFVPWNYTFCNSQMVQYTQGKSLRLKASPVVYYLLQKCRRISIYGRQIFLQ